MWQRLAEERFSTINGRESEFLREIFNDIFNEVFGRGDDAVINIDWHVQRYREAKVNQRRHHKK
jgi:hypothetical protein